MALLDWKRRHRHEQARAEARRQLDHLPIEGQAAGTELPKKVIDWFRDLSLLKGVPFNYLVPDERLLPQESLRFFWMDAYWIDCLLDGAFSIGRALPTDLQRDAGHAAKPHANPHAVVTGLLMRSDVVPGWPDLQVDGYDQQVLDEDFEGPVKEPRAGVSGKNDLSTERATSLQKALDSEDVAEVRNQFNFGDGDLRIFPTAEPSPTIGDGTKQPSWVVNVNKNEEIYLVRRTGNTFLVRLENKLQLLRMTRLSPHVLLCMFAGDIKTVDIHEKPEALHFGVNRPEEAGSDAYYRELKNEKGGELTSIRESMGPHWKDKSLRVIDIDKLATAIRANETFKTRTTFNSWTSAQFALQMVEGVQKVRFPWRKND